MTEDNLLFNRGTAFFVLAVVVCFSGFIGLYHLIAKYQCEQRGVMAGVETKYIFMDRCYIRAGDNWRVFGECTGVGDE